MTAELNEMVQYVSLACHCTMFYSLEIMVFVTKKMSTLLSTLEGFLTPLTPVKPAPIPQNHLNLHRG